MTSASPSADREPTILVAVALVFALIVIEFFAILQLNGGEFSYALDDAYIHLALAEQLRSGHYGLTPNVTSSPSSSVIWPFLLAPLAGTPLFEWAPLLLNVASCLGFTGALYVLFWKVGAVRNGALPGALPCTVLVVLATNAVPTVFLGLEHSLQLFLIALTGLGLFNFVEQGRFRALDLLLVLLGPLVRYENLGVSVAFVAVLCAERRLLPALVVAAASFTGPLFLGLFFRAHGLPWLPTSVVAKSNIASFPRLGDFALSALGHLAEGLAHSGRALLLGVGLALQVWFYLEARTSLVPKKRRICQVALVVGISLLLHLAFGDYGRYELYVWCLLLLGFGISFSVLFEKWTWTRARAFAGALVVLVCAAPYLGRLVQTPFGAHSIFAQHGTMAALASRLGERVAVNDIGLVSFRSPSGALDLWGLGAYEVLLVRKSRNDNLWMDEILAKQRVRFAFIYDAWFVGQVPPSWLRVGTFDYQGALPSTAERSVALYARDSESAQVLRRQLEQLGELPAGLSLTISHPAAN
jgi:hypothetical protein